MNEFEYHSPGTLSEACEILKKYGNSAYILAGGTDLIPKMYHHQLQPEHVVNIKRIPELNKIEFDPTKGLTLGALVNFNDIIYSELVQNNYPILMEVSKKIASHQIRNLATVGGNLCNAAPSSDSAPILIALDSTITITATGKKGKPRIIQLEEFFTGPGETALRPGEILTQIQIPPIKPCTGLGYIKHTTRKALEIAVVGVAGRIQLEKDTEKCVDARVVIGACAPTPLRVPAAEQQLIGNTITERALGSASETASAAVKPITDVRAGDAYRREIVKVQCKRVLEETVAKARKNCG